jgi:hypothetical protein
VGGVREDLFPVAVAMCDAMSKKGEAANTFSRNLSRLKYAWKKDAAWSSRQESIATSGVIPPNLTDKMAQTSKYNIKADNEGVCQNSRKKNPEMVGLAKTLLYEYDIFAFGQTAKLLPKA